MFLLYLPSCYNCFFSFCTTFHDIPDIGKMVRVFANGAGDLVQSQLESYQRLKKWYLMLPCLTLSIIRYRSRIKWSNPWKGIVPSPTLWCSSYWKGGLQVILDYGWLFFYDIRYSYQIQTICIAIVWCQVFLSNTNNYMVSNNYFYLIIVICHTVLSNYS